MGRPGSLWVAGDLGTSALLDATWHALGAQDLAANVGSQARDVPLMEFMTPENSPEVPGGQKCDRNKVQP